MNNYYFGTHAELLDPQSLKQVCFGVLWCDDGGHSYIVGYCFEDDPFAVLRQCRKNYPVSWLECRDPEVIYEKYKCIRERQRAQDWNAHRRLPLFSVLRLPWKDVAPGWYVLKSRRNFPYHLSIIHRKFHSVWLEHAAVCENEDELQALVSKAADTHHIPLQIMEFGEDSKWT
jgi:hypothetical protein